MKDKPKFNIRDRKAIDVDLNDFCYLAKKGDFMQITAWTNGDGYDVAINDTMFSVTHGQLKAIKKITKKLDKL